MARNHSYIYTNKAFYDDKNKLEIKRKSFSPCCYLSKALYYLAWAKSGKTVEERKGN